jgi:hypothetical protein
MILKIFAEFVGELISADSTSAVLPWKSIHRTKGNIISSSNIPKNIKLLRTYLNRFYLNRTLDMEIREEMQHWLQDGDHGLYYKMLQVEESTEIGWFLYSTKEMDTGALVDEIHDLIRIKVGLRWKIIGVGIKGKLQESQRVQAFNAEVDLRNRWEAQRALINYFERNIKNLTDYPNDIRLRFIKNKSDSINYIEKGKIEKLHARQKAYLPNIVSIKTWDIIQLDYPSEPNKPMLHQMIMTLTTSKNDIPLFHCVDLDW